MATRLLSLGAGALVALTLLAHGFRRSHDSSATENWKFLASVVTMRALLASFNGADERLALQGAMLLAVALLAGYLWVSCEAACGGVTGVAFWGLWLGYYWQVAWGQPLFLSCGSTGSAVPLDPHLLAQHPPQRLQPAVWSKRPAWAMCRWRQFSGQEPAGNSAWRQPLNATRASMPLHVG